MSVNANASPSPTRSKGRPKAQASAFARPLRRVLLALLALSGLLAAWVGLSLAGLYSTVVFSTAEKLLPLGPSPAGALALRPPPLASASNEDEGFAVLLDGRPLFRFDRYGTFFNVPLLGALGLAAPGLSAGARLARTALGLGMLALAHVAFVWVYVKAQLVNLGMLNVSAGAAYALNWLALLLGPVGDVLFPLAIAAGLVGRPWAEALGLRLPQAARMSRRGEVGRNAPCPCGSGRKHKRCCGRR